MRVHEAAWVLTEARREASFQRQWEMLWMLGGVSSGGPLDFLWRFCEVPVQVPHSFRLLWPPALVCTSIFTAFPECGANPALILVNLQEMFWWSEIEAVLFDPLLVRSSAEGLCTGLFLLRSHSRSPPGPCLDQSPRYCLSFVFVWIFPPYPMNCQSLIQIRVEETFKGYL